MAKHIFVTGGVVSSLGKGITAASLGMLLKAWGLKVKLQKFDPYLNVDPGTMNPYQHGEVYVTDDGAETDLDLGHYERFTGEPTSRDCNYTAGMVYNSVITKERRGDYLGQTIQVVPHITDEIKSCVRTLAVPEVDVVISEIGGTVGDIEGLPFLEAIRQVGLDEGRSNVLYIHVTLVPYIRAAQEIKTKPTQHSVGRLREIGIIPDVLICRTEKPLNDQIKAKISLFCNVEKRAVIEEPDVEDTIYEVPFMFTEQGLDRLIIERLGLKAGTLDLGPWPEILETIRHPTDTVTIAVVGKYGELQDAYKSIYEAIDHGGIASRCRGRHARSGREPGGRRCGSIARRCGRHSGAGRIRLPRPGGQDRRRGLRARARHPLPGHLPGPSMCGRRVRPQRLRPRRGGQHGDRPRYRRPRHQPPGGAERRRAEGRHDAPRRLPLRAPGRLPGARGVRQQPGERAPPPPL